MMETTKMTTMTTMTMRMITTRGAAAISEGRNWTKQRVRSARSARGSGASARSPTKTTVLGRSLKTSRMVTRPKRTVEARALKTPTTSNLLASFDDFFL